MKKRFLEAGRIVTTFGISGEVKVDVWGDRPEFLNSFDTIYFSGGKEAVSVERFRVHKNSAVLKLKGIEDLNEASKLRGKVIFIDRDDFDLPDGSFFIQDLIGLEVIDADSGDFYGHITQVSSTGANDVYHIKKENREYLMPAVKEMVPEINIEKGTVLVRPIEGIFDDH